MTAVEVVLGHDLHARPVAAFSSAVTASGVHVTLTRTDDKPLDAGNMLLLMSAGLRAGERVTLTVTNAPDVLIALRSMLTAAD